MLGNALFFCLSGFILSRQDEANFIYWIFGRIIRVYTPLLLWNCILLLFWKERVDSVLEFIGIPWYWFAPAIVMLYVPMFFISKIKKIRTLIFLLSVFILIYIAQYCIDGCIDGKEADQFFWLKVSFGAVGFILGIIMNKFMPIDIKKLKHYTFAMPICIICAVGYIVSCFLFNRDVSLFVKCQFIQHLFCFGFAVCLFLWLHIYENGFLKMKNDYFKIIINFISIHSFELYLVQLLFFNICREWFFPLNLFATIFFTVPVAEIIHICSKKIIGVVNQGLVSRVHYKEKSRRTKYE